jgi:hypothetical protein
MGVEQEDREEVKTPTRKTRVWGTRVWTTRPEFKE